LNNKVKRWVIASYVGGLITVKTPSEEKSARLTITALDLSIVDNKIAMLKMINGKGPYILTEPQPGLAHDKAVDHVIQQMLSTYLSRLSGYIFTKSADKDTIVIRSLANLHESIAGKELQRSPTFVSKGCQTPNTYQRPPSTDLPQHHSSSC
jgi:hypothetical protein